MILEEVTKFSDKIYVLLSLFYNNIASRILNYD